MMLALSMIFASLASAAEQSAPFSQEARAYSRSCAHCHASTATGHGAQGIAARQGAARALLHERKDLSAELIRFAVRKGYLGMPPMTRVEVSDAELEKIVQYLTETRQDGAK